MRLARILKPLVLITQIFLLVSLTSGCLDQGELNNDAESYQPEDRPLGVIAGDGSEAAPGSTVVLSGRLVGRPITNQSVIWTQLSGTPVEADDWTSERLTFIAPTVEGIVELTFQIAALDGNGDPLLNDDDTPMVDQVTITVFDPDLLIRYEVEDSTVAQLLGGAALVTPGAGQYINGANGESHTADLQPGMSVLFTLDIPEQSFYTLYVRYAIPSDYGGKVGQIDVNGIVYDLDFSATSAWEEIRVGVVQLNAGTNTLEIGAGWNYYRIDGIAMIPSAPPAGPSPVAPTLVNENASESALDLMEFLTSNYGTGTLTGQTEFMNYGDVAQTGLREFDKIVAATGDDAPAIVAFDLMDYSVSRVDCGAAPGTLSEDMIAEHNAKNVVLSALWHWNTPADLNDSDCSGEAGGDDQQAWWFGFYTRATTFDLAAALADTNSAEYMLLIDDIDAISAELQKFEDANIPILWRPLHEAEGAWFWWGAAGSDALRELWILMYDRMTTTHGLDNLIWVFTHAGNLDETWYPGDEYVDIVGYDGYDGNNADSPFSSQYSTLKNRHNGSKLVALTETGTIPNVELMHTTNAWWSFFITWNSGDVYGPDGADPADIDMFYAYEGSINLAEVPGGRTPIEAGLYESFENSTFDWGAQVNWSNTDGLTTASDWASSALYSLSITKDMTAITTPENVVFQTYPEGGIDVSGMSAIEIDVNTIGAGSAVTAHIFWKAPDGIENWPSSVAVPVDGTTLTISLVDAVDGDSNPVEITSLDGLGVRFEGLDETATSAQYLIDNVTLVAADDSRSAIYDFEPDGSGWGTQVGWSNTSGMTVSSEWASTGARSLAFYKDLVAHGSASDIVFQTYPADGIDVTGMTDITIDVQAIDAGAAVDAHIFWKAEGGVESWPASVAVTASGVQLSISLTDQVDGDSNPIVLTSLTGLGVRFNNVDAASTDAKFFIDNVSLVDGGGSTVLYDFEGTGEWGFQVKWSGADGMQLSDGWAAEGTYALSATRQLVSGDNNIVFQVYPTGGILLGEVSTMKINAYVVDAGAATTAHIFWKSPGGDESWPAGVAVTDSGVELSIDVSTVSELSGFGVRFENADNFATPSQFFIDNIAFE